jgi:AraC-like DNA-binding protein
MPNRPVASTFRRKRRCGKIFQLLIPERSSVSDTARRCGLANSL